MEVGWPTLAYPENEPDAPIDRTTTLNCANPVPAIALAAEVAPATIVPVSVVVPILIRPVQVLVVVPVRVPIIVPRMMSPGWKKFAPTVTEPT